MQHCLVWTPWASGGAMFADSGAVNDAVLERFHKWHHWIHRKMHYKRVIIFCHWAHFFPQKNHVHGGAKDRHVWLFRKKEKKKRTRYSFVKYCSRTRSSPPILTISMLWCRTRYGSPYILWYSSTEQVMMKYNSCWGPSIYINFLILDLLMHFTLVEGELFAWVLTRAS